MSAGRPTIDDVATAVFETLDLFLEDGLDAAAIGHMTTVIERDIDHRPYEQRLVVDGDSYVVTVASATGPADAPRLERAARAICIAHGISPDDWDDDGDGPVYRWQAELAAAAAAIAA